MNTSSKRAAHSTSSTSPLEIDQLLAELATSDMTTLAFARKRGIPPWRLYNALRGASVTVCYRSVVTPA